MHFKYFEHFKNLKKNQLFYLRKSKLLACQERVDKDKVCVCVNVCCQLEGAIMERVLSNILHLIKFRLGEGAK